tara:strand:- start:452 stop:1978 length:1527 start_codon:yes stop_codon:yes gene_type:complete
MNKISPYIMAGTAVALLMSFSDIHAQTKEKFLSGNVNASGEITGFTPKQAGMVRKKSASSASASQCGQFVKRKKWKPGFNNKGQPDEFAIAIGIAPTEKKMGAPGYIDSRHVAFREAWLKANTQMAAALEQRIRTEASSRMLPATRGLGKPTSDAERAKDLRRQAYQIKGPETGVTLSTTVNKGMRWLNAMLDEELKGKGIDVQAEKKARAAKTEAERNALLKKAKSAEAEAKKLLRSRRFEEVIEAAARERMKGIYSKFSNENLATDSDVAQICVVLKYSKRSEILAEAMAKRDFSNVPTLPAKTKTILEQLPDPSDPKGVFELLKQWGLTVMVDKKGQANLVAYGQAEVDGNDSNALIAAKTTADLRARALLRLFINQTAAVLAKAETAQNVKSYKKGLTDVQISTQARKEMEQGAGFKKINGIREVLDWRGVHPVTSQGIYGVVVAWNASEAAGALVSKKRQNRVVKDTGGIKSLKKPVINEGKPEKRPPLRRGGLSGTTKSTDF